MLACLDLKTDKLVYKESTPRPDGRLAGRGARQAAVRAGIGQDGRAWSPGREFKVVGKQHADGGNSTSAPRRPSPTASSICARKRTCIASARRRLFAASRRGAETRHNTAQHARTTSQAARR